MTNTIRKETALCTQLLNTFVAANGTIEYLDTMRNVLGSIPVSGASIRVLSPQLDEILQGSGIEEGATVLDILVRPGDEFTLHLHAKQHACVFALAGRPALNGAEVAQSEVREYAQGDEVHIRAKGVLPCRVIYCAS